VASGSERNFDYVIVGAGSAGCVLANRLTQDPNTTVLLLEAGGASTGLFKDMPIAFPNYVVRRDLNWNFESEPEPYCSGRRIEIPRGKGLGGSSMINGMVYARGHRLDYDDWAARGLAGWSYAEVLPPAATSCAASRRISFSSSAIPSIGMCCARVMPRSKHRLPMNPSMKSALSPSDGFYRTQSTARMPEAMMPAADDVDGMPCIPPPCR